MNLSIIIVTYNEEKNISSCLASVFKLMENKDLEYEVIIVDSMSTDQTIEKSKEYNVKVIQLRNFRSPSTAKYIGYLNSSGEFLLFLDGDMELLIDYSQLQTYLNFIKKDKIAGVQGYLEDYHNGKKINVLRIVKKPTSVNCLPGSAFYSRISLEKNNFNPNLNANEERELGYRLKKEGYEMKILPLAMVKHKRRSISLGMREISRRHKNNYYLGLGQVIRSNFRDPILFLKHLIDQKVIVLFFLTFTFFPFSFLINIEIAYGIIILHFLAILYYFISYHSISRYIDKIFCSWGIVHGFISYCDRKIKYRII